MGCCHELNQLDWALTFLGWFLNVKTGKIFFFVLDFILHVLQNAKNFDLSVYYARLQAEFDYCPFKSAQNDLKGA